LIDEEEPRIGEATAEALKQGETRKCTFVAFLPLRFLSFFSSRWKEICLLLAFILFGKKSSLRLCFWVFETRNSTPYGGNVCRLELESLFSCTTASTQEKNKKETSSY